MEIATETNCLEIGLVIMIFSLLLSFISSSSYYHLNAIELLTTDKFLLRLTKFSINISITLIHLAKRHYRFFIVNKILIVLAQTFISVSSTIMLYLNNFLGKII